jgi:hypothetical protein
MIRPVSSSSLLPLGKLPVFLLFCSLPVASCLGADGIYKSFTIDKWVRGKDCKIKPSGEGEAKTVKPGETYQAGATGITGNQSDFVVLFDERNKFHILQKTEVVIHPATSNPRFRKVVDLSLHKGKVDVDLENFPKGYELKVQTPTAVCGAVGTKFTVETAGLDGNGADKFECTESKIQVQALPYDADLKDGTLKGFTASVGEGQHLQARINPGRENSHSRLETSENVQVTIGANTFNTGAGTVLEVAQEQKSSTKEIAVSLKKGQLGDQKAGRYIVKDSKLVQTDEKQAKLVDEYIAAAGEEGTLRRRVRRNEAQGVSDPNLEKKLEQAANEATRKRKALFEYRGIIQERVRQGLDATRGAGQPTVRPR